MSDPEPANLRVRAARRPEIRRAAAVALASLLAACFDRSPQPAPAPQQPAWNAPPPYGPAPGYGAPGPYAPPPYGAQPPPYAPPAAPPPPGAPPPAAPPATAVPAAAPPGLPLPPPGSIDASGAFAPQFVRDEPQAVLAELVAALPAASRTRVAGLPLTLVDDPNQVNAFAACTSSGAGVLAVTTPLLVIAARTSEARAFDETFGTRKHDEALAAFAADVRAKRAVVGPGPGFLPSPQALDPRKLARQRQLFDEQVAFVLGHELAHHHRGHTGCASGARTAAPDEIARLLSQAVPLFNQPNEIDADVSGTYDVLDAGARRTGGAWTEEGAVMTLGFFSRLADLGVDSLLLGFLATHPAPQLRSPIVLGAATQWRATGGHPVVLPSIFLP